MQPYSNEPQIKQSTEIVRLHKTTRPLRRWVIDSRYNSTLVVVTVKNLSEDGELATLKFQDSNGSPGDDHQCTIGVPVTPGGQVASDPDNVNEVFTFTETFGGFNSTFANEVRLDVNPA